MRWSSSLRLVSLVVALAAPASANAWAPPPATDEARLAADLPIARAAWPGSPCAGREIVHLHADLRLAEMDALDGIHSGGRAQVAMCEVWLVSYATPDAFCDALVHELGHLAGYGHTGVGGDVQAPSGPQAMAMQESPSYPACRSALRDLVWQLLPAAHTTWRIACTPLQLGHGRCSAVTARGRMFHFRVRSTGGSPIAEEDWEDNVIKRAPASTAASRSPGS